MKYPTMNEVNAADRYQLAQWYRFLDSPGASAIGSPEFQEMLQAEKPIMDRIYDRFMQSGGMTSEISKTIGWENRNA